MIDGSIIPEATRTQALLLYRDAKQEVTSSCQEFASFSFNVISKSPPQLDEPHAENFSKGLKEISQRGHSRVGFLIHAEKVQRDWNSEPDYHLKGADRILYNILVSVSFEVKIVNVVEENGQVCLQTVKSFDSLKGESPFFENVYNDPMHHRVPVSQEAPFDEYDCIRVNVEKEPSLFHSRYKLGDVVFLASSKQMRKKHIFAGGELSETHKISFPDLYTSLAVVATLNPELV